MHVGWWKWSCIFGTQNPFRPLIRVYLIHIDNLLIVMEDEVTHFNPFLAFLNLNNQELSFTGQQDIRSICYLDVKLTIKNLGIDTSIYRKPLSGKTLFAQSDHPRHTIKGIHVGQFLRVRRKPSLCTGVF